MDNQVELKCNDNRRLKVEVARSSSQYHQQPRFSLGSSNLRSGKSEDRVGSNASVPIDGRQFRGGMYNNNTRIATNNRRGSNNERPFYNNKEGADNLRTNRSSSDRSLTMDPSQQQQPQEEKRQRPTLKLLPRTKPLEEKIDKAESTAPSDAAKQPPEAWQSSKREVIPEPAADASKIKDSSNNLDTIKGAVETNLAADSSKKAENMNPRGKQQQQQQRNRSNGEQPRKKTGKSEPIKRKQQQRGKTSSENGTWEEPKKVLPTASLVPPKASVPAPSVVKVTNAFAALGDSDSDE